MSDFRIELPADFGPDDIADTIIALSGEPGVSESLGQFSPFPEDELAPSTSLWERLSKAIKPGGPAHAGLSAEQVRVRQDAATAGMAGAQSAFAFALGENFGAWDAAVSLAQSGKISGQLSLDGALSLRGKIWTVVERDARRVIRDAYRAMWKRGRESAGVFKPMSRDESLELERMYRAQQNFFLNFLRDREEGTGRMNPAQRLELYGAALRQAFFAGQVLADLSSDVFFGWLVGESEHCGDCLKLARGGRRKNGIYSARELARLGVWPGSGHTECLVHCGCGLKRVAAPTARPTAKAFSRDELTGSSANPFNGNGRVGRESFERGAQRNSWKHKGRK